jgi:hypothetical protein
MSRPPVDAAPTRTLYEALRGEALGACADGTPSHGLALFLLRGMSAWWVAVTALSAPCASSRPATEDAHEHTPSPPPDLRTALTTVLAGMVLACLPEGDVAC